MENINVVRLYFAETRGASFNIKAGLDTEIRAMYRSFLERLAGVFASGIKRGLFKDIKPYYLAVAIDSLTNAFLFCWLDDPKRHPYPRNAEMILKMFFEQIKIG